jgi:hypothetical protein
MPLNSVIAAFAQRWLGLLNLPSIDKLASTQLVQATLASSLGKYIFLAIPPVGRTRSRATGTEDTFV